MVRSRLILFCLLLPSGCAYFNTYYNAETAFRQGYAIHRNVLKNYPDSILVTPPDEARTKYERTVEKSIKVIDVYTKDIKYHDDALFLTAKAYFYKRDTEKAIKRFRELQQTFPSSPFIPESYVYLGESYIEEDELNKAEEVLTRALNLYPYIDKNQKVSLLLAEIAVRRGGKSQAIALLEQIKNKTMSDEKKINLILRISELYINMGKYRKAIPLLLSAPRKRDLPVQSFRTDMALLTCYIEIDSFTIALKLSDAMLKKRSYFDYKNQILYRKGILLERIGKIDDAVVVFKSITAGFDSTKIQSDTSSVVGKAFLELALLYQQKKKDYKTAEKYFSNASKAHDSTVAVIASRRVHAMELLKNLRNEKDSTKHALTCFKIGELFRFELDEPDSAYLQLISLSKEPSTDSLMIPKSLCAAALIARDDLHDTTRADSLLQYILKTFSTTEFAQKAQIELNLPLTVKTRSDSAHDAFLKAEDLFYAQNKAIEAVKAYYDVYRNYSELDIAPKSLFAAAWISDEVLQKNVTAEKLYEKICEKYPESIYCTEESKPRVKIAEDTLKALKLANKGKISAVSDNENQSDTGKNSNAASDLNSQGKINKNESSNLVSAVNPNSDSLKNTISSQPILAKQDTLQMIQSPNRNMPVVK